MSKSIYLIRPSRSTTGYIPTLNQEHIDKNNSNGIETNIYLDLNILSKIRQVMGGKVPFHDTFLPELVIFLSSIRGVYINPGMALYEANGFYGIHNHKALEAFLRSYLPDFRDAYNSLPANFSNRLIKNFFQLDGRYKELLKVNYASILAIHYINLFFKENDWNEALDSQFTSNLESIEGINRKDLIGGAKFYYYLNLMSVKADVIGAIEVELAKLSFFNWSQINTPTSINYRSIIKNFIKKSSNFDQLLSNSLNAATDINYYRCLAWVEEESSIATENWLLSADKGIKELSKFIFHVKGASSLLKTEKKDKLFELPYWLKCDNMHAACQNSRQEDFRNGKEIDRAKLDLFIIDMESKIRKKLE